MENAFLDFGLVMVMMIVATTPMRTTPIVQLILVSHLNLDVPMADAFSTHGNVIMKMIVVMALMSWIVTTKIVDLVNSLVKITDVFRTVKFVMVSMIVKIILLLMSHWRLAKIRMSPVLTTTSNVNQLPFVLNHTGFVMATMTVGTILMKMNSIAVQDLAHQTASDVLIIGVFQPLGIVMAILIVTAVRMNLKTNVKRRTELVMETCLLVTMATAFQEFMFVMATMTVLTTLMKVKTDNVKPELVIKKLNLLAKPIENGEEPFVSRKIGSVMVIQTVLMVLMRTEPNSPTVMSR